MAENRLPDDSVHAVGGLIFTVIWIMFILCGLIAVVTLVVLPRETLVDVARSDAVVQGYDSFPFGSMPWGFSVAGHEVNATRLVVNTPIGESDDSILSQAYRSNAVKLQPFYVKISAYWALIWPRLVVMAGFLPGLAALAWAAWGFGAHLQAAYQPIGQALSTQSYKYWKAGLSFSVAILFSYPALPFPVSSWMLLIPMVLVLISTVYVRRWRK